MTVTVTVSGEGISFEREISESTAPQIMETAMDEDMEDGKVVTVSLSGEGMSFERETSELVGLQVMEVSITNGSREVTTSASEGDTEEQSGLPDSFFNRLTDRQEAFVRILLEADDWMLNEDIRQKMEEEYGLSSGGGQAIAGILSGFTRKYGKDFSDSLVENRWTGDQVKYRLNRDSDYEKELREGLNETE